MFFQAHRFDCEKCSWGRYCDDDYRWPTSRGPAPTELWIIKGVIESRTCLLPMITPQSRFLLELFGHYLHRVLPYRGGVLDQPNYYREAMQVIDAARKQAGIGDGG